MVRGLVEEQHVGRGGQHLRQQHAQLEAAGERGQRLAVHLGGDAEPLEDVAGARLGGVAVVPRDRFLELGEAVGVELARGRWRGARSFSTIASQSSWWPIMRDFEDLLVLVEEPIISGNWKMHHNHFEAIQTVQKLAYLARQGRPRRRSTSASTRRSPTSASVQTRRSRPTSSKLVLGAQHCHWEDKGAFTGEVVARCSSPSSTSSYVIVGHCERRELFGETDEMVNKKVKAILRQRHDADPVLSARRSRSARPGRPRPRCSGRSAPGSPGVTTEQVAGLVIAYEPIWAIGTGRTATAEDAQAVCARDPRARSPSCRRRAPPTRCASSTAGR